MKPVEKYGVVVSVHDDVVCVERACLGAVARIFQCLELIVVAIWLSNEIGVRTSRDIVVSCRLCQTAVYSRNNRVGLEESIIHGCGGACGQREYGNGSKFELAAVAKVVRVGDVDSHVHCGSRVDDLERRLGQVLSSDVDAIALERNGETWKN